MPPTRTSYHHGALRETLLDATLRLIEAEGIAAVSLRRVAREAGVSPGAPYHHFADRADLLAALSARGYELLAADLAQARTEARTSTGTTTRTSTGTEARTSIGTEARTGTGTEARTGTGTGARTGTGTETAPPVRALTGLMRGYVAFARREPGYFRLMFRPELSGPREQPALKAAEHAAEAQLEAAVADCVTAGIVAADQAEALGVAAWSLAHGLASLWLDGQLRDEYDDPDTIAAQVAALVESAFAR
jgi:AcrR family transcriptional regulator